MSVSATRRGTPWTSSAARSSLEITASMPGVPGASPFSGDASGRVFAACADRVDLDWVPDDEDQLVPEEQLKLCLGCPARTACLGWAIATSSEGYWAGTTTADRRELEARGQVTTAAADVLRTRVAADLEARAGQTQPAEAPLHEPGAGSMTWYGRHGCRCTECKRANADKRAGQRRRRRNRLQAAVCRRTAA